MYSLFFIVEEVIEELEGKFRAMIKDVREKINQKNIEVGKFRDTVKEKLPQRLLGLKHHIEYEHIDDNDVTIFFETLDDIWDFLDYDLLRFIIRRCGDEDLKAKMADYEGRMQTFIENTTVFDFINTWKPRFADDQIPEHFKTCIMKLLWDPFHSKLKDLIIIQHKIRKILPQELAMTAFVMCHLKCSSVIVVWLVWTELVSQVMERMQNFIKQSPEFLIKNKLCYLILDGALLCSDVTDTVYFKVSYTFPIIQVCPYSSYLY